MGLAYILINGLWMLATVEKQNAEYEVSIPILWEGSFFLLSVFRVLQKVLLTLPALSNSQKSEKNCKNIKAIIQSTSNHSPVV